MGNHKSKLKKSKTKKGKSKLNNSDMMVNPDFTAYDLNNSAIAASPYNNLIYSHHIPQIELLKNKKY